MQRLALGDDGMDGFCLPSDEKRQITESGGSLNRGTAGLENDFHMTLPPDRHRKEEV